ncbi:MAG TPA: MotA/TolQ/ExbB proton channel family protein [Methylobacter sp.]|jgi:biopolymer transport protein ExbB
MQAEYLLDNLKFISQGGAVSMTVAAALLAMSIGSWTLMVIKAIQARRIKSSSAIFLTHFWQASSTTSSSMATAMSEDLKKAKNPFMRLAIQGINAAAHHNRYTARLLAKRVVAAASTDCNETKTGATTKNSETTALQEHLRHDEFISQALRRAIGQEHMRLETGLTLLASVGSIAPFIGLFGTVWGIYHALGSIAVGGQATVDKVAGPVGEALIMTALGLAVAIPAVLAYNALVRDNRVLMGEVETFAHDLHTYLTTGIPLATVTTEMAFNTDGAIYGTVAVSAEALP